MTKTFDKIKEIVIDQLGVEDNVEITEVTSLIGDLEADSLDAVEVVMALEDEFDIEIPDEDAEKFKNLGDIAKYINSKI